MHTPSRVSDSPRVHLVLSDAEYGKIRECLTLLQQARSYACMAAEALQDVRGCESALSAVLVAHDAVKAGCYKVRYRRDELKEKGGAQ